MRTLMERGEGEARRDAVRALGESFVADMDRTVREAGVGDLGVARRVKALYAHLLAIHARLDGAAAGDTSFTAALAEIFEVDGAADHPGLLRLVGELEEARTRVGAATGPAALALVDPYPPATPSRPRSVA